MRQPPFPQLAELFAERIVGQCLLCPEEISKLRLVCPACKPEYMRLYFAAWMAEQRRLYPALARNARDGSFGPRKRKYKPREPRYLP